MTEVEHELDENGEQVETPDEIEPDENIETADESELAPEPAAMSEAEIERAMKSLDKEGTRHANRISEIMGADAQQLEPCPLCIPNMAGFVFPDAIPEDQRQTVLALLTGAADDAYQDDPLAGECEVCNGYGYTTTGSKVLEHLRRPCPACIGMGFMDHTRRAQWEGEQALRNPPAPPPQIVPAYVPPSNGTPDTDEWGRPRGHWLYGKNPRYLADHERAGDLPHIQAV